MRARALRSVAGWAYCGLLLAFVTIPIAIMVPASFGSAEVLQFPPRGFSLHWYREVLGDQRWLASAWLSLQLALVAALLATLAGFMVAIEHLRFGRVRPLMRAYLLLPLVAPHIVLAAGLFSMLLQARLLGSPGALALAQCCLALPLAVVVLLNAVEAIDPLLWTAASSLGARWWTVLGRVILPNLWLSLVVALLVAFNAAWDEVTFAVFFGPIRTPTLPSKMFSYLQELINPAVTAIATLLMAVTLLLALFTAVIPQLLRARGRR